MNQVDPDELRRVAEALASDDLSGIAVKMYEAANEVEVLRAENDELREVASGDWTVAFRTMRTENAEMARRIRLLELGLKREHERNRASNGHIEGLFERPETLLRDDYDDDIVGMGHRGD